MQNFCMAFLFLVENLLMKNLTIACIALLTAIGSAWITSNQIILKTEEMRIKPSNGALLHAMSCGYGGFGATLFWVSAIIDFAGKLFNETKGESIPGKVFVVTSLDTVWKYPHEFAGLGLQTSGNEPDSIGIYIMSRGLNRFPDDGRFAILYSQMLQECSWIDSSTRVDSAIKVLLPLVNSNAKVPEYGRTLAFTLLVKRGKIDEAISRLATIYQGTQDPLLQYLFQKKIGDLLARGGVHFQRDSITFVSGIGLMLKADSSQAASAKDLLIRLVQPETKDAALLEARHLARQFRSFQAAQLGTQQ